MNMLRPVPGPYDPKYPRELSDEEIEKLLRPGLFARFSRETLLSGALLAGMTLGALGQEPTPPAKPPLGKEEFEAAKTKALALAKETLGGYKIGSWNQYTSIHLAPGLEANPRVKYPAIPICFGNSHVGIFDTKKAIDTTKKLFEIYGIKLQAGQTVKGEGFTFVADGYDPDAKIGFKMTLPEEYGQEAKAKDPDKSIDASEVKPLSAAITAGKLRMFVVDAGGFPNMDGDLYTPMEYYLSSVIDYLNWAQGGMEIDPEKVFGKKPAPRKR